MPHLTYDYSVGLGAGFGFQFLHRTSKALDIRIEPHFQFSAYKSRMNYYENPNYGIVPYYITHKITDLQLGLNLHTGISIVNTPGFKLRAIAGIHSRIISTYHKEVEKTLVAWPLPTESSVSYALGFGPNAGWEITFNRKGQFTIQNIYSLSVSGLSNKSTYGFGLFTASLGVGYRFTKEKNKQTSVVNPSAE